MREFRAKTTKKENRGHAFNNVWVEGDLVISGDKYYIHPRANTFQVDNELAKLVIMHEVIPETVGQYVGKDKNGKKIFEGDIHERENHFFVVKYGKYRDCETNEDVYGWYFEYTHRKGCEGFDGTESQYVNIIGNIHDNKELLEIGE